MLSDTAQTVIKKEINLMPENLTHSLSFLKKSSEKKGVYHHFISRNADILTTVVKTTSDGLYSIEAILKGSNQNTAECGNYEYTILKDDMRIIRSELFNGLFNSVLISGNEVKALFIPHNVEAIQLDKAEEIQESRLLGYDHRLFNSLKIVIEGVLTQVETRKIAASLKAFFDEAYKEQDVEVTTESEKHLDKRAFDIIFYEEDSEKVKSAEYLVKAMLEITKSELHKKSILYYTGIAFSKDKMLKTVRLVIEKEEDVIYTLDSRNREFYITNRKTLEKITANEFEGSDKEVITFKIAEQLLLAVDGKIEVSEFFNDLVESRK